MAAPLVLNMFRIGSLDLWGNVWGCAFGTVILCSGFSPLGTYLASIKCRQLCIML